MYWGTVAGVELIELLVFFEGCGDFGRRALLTHLSRGAPTPLIIRLKVI